MAAHVAEDACLRGEWDAALALSKEQLVRGAPAAADSERLLSVYLQSVFELEKYDEVEAAGELVQALEPLPFELALQWINFLVAMNQSEAAMDRITALQTHLQQQLLLQGDSDPAPHRREYARLLDVLVFQVLLPSESVATVREVVCSDKVLDEISKQKLLERVDSFVDEHIRTAAEASAAQATSPPLTRSESTQTSLAFAFGGATSSPATSKQSERSPHQKQHVEDDESSKYVLIGSAVLAATVAAIGAVRYKRQLRESLESVVPAISKGLADAKYALFEA